MRLHSIGGSCQERSCGIAIADVSGLVAGVDTGVGANELGGVGEQLGPGVGLVAGGASLVVDEKEMFMSGIPPISSLPFSTP